jgi:hypothetical protein
MSGQFEKQAFNAFIYPKPGARRFERQEHRAAAFNPLASHQSAVFYTLGGEAQKPSRLRLQVDKYQEKRATMPKSLSETALEASARLGNCTDRSEAAASSALETGRSEPQEPERRWYPHPTHLRGLMKLNKARALDWGIDTTNDKGYRCPFWEAPVHRFEAVAKMPEARPITPTRSLRWRSTDHWNNPEMHAPLKVTQTLPRSLSNTATARTVTPTTSSLTR